MKVHLKDKGFFCIHKGATTQRSQNYAALCHLCSAAARRMLR
jgi:hypothetical protein